jgi:hypothetical protein
MNAPALKRFTIEKYQVKRVALPHKVVKLPQLSDLELDLSIVFPSAEVTPKSFRLSENQ